MFSTSEQRSADTPESWYGEPQHEDGVDGSIEFERYGEPNHEQPAGPIEFVPEVEYPSDGPVGGSRRTKRKVPVLRIGGD
ncbi:hypothetical protein [Halalkalicoccus salilacus]|uniref:hypothetical protein n=1 Tax=Halalkalicoccus TaxID=332246 RepID=UPI002F96B1E5